MPDEIVTKAEVEALQKRLEKAETDATAAKADATAQAAKVQKMEIEKRTAEFTKQAEGYAKALPIKPAEFAPILLKMADALTADEMKEIDRILSAAQEASRVGKLFKEIGSDNPAEGSAEAKAQAEVVKAMAADPKLSEQAARGIVYKKNPALRREVEAENTERAQAGR